MGASDDGSYVYFVANGVLAPGASPGDCHRVDSFSQTCSLYLLHNGVTTFIAAVNGEDLGDWYQRESGLNGTSVVSHDGHYLAFGSLNSLTGYDNLATNGVTCGTRLRCAEVYLYHAATGAAGTLSCASCNPSGGSPACPRSSPPPMETRVII